MTVRTFLAAALCAVLLVSNASARPLHRRQHSVVSRIEIPPGLHRVMAEGAGRVVANPTCDDVRAVVAWVGEARAVKMAREAGASNYQIDKARRCLK